MIHAQCANPEDLQVLFDHMLNGSSYHLGREGLDASVTFKKNGQELEISIPPGTGRLPFRFDTNINGVQIYGFVPAYWLPHIIDLGKPNVVSNIRDYIKTE